MNCCTAKHDRPQFDHGFPLAGHAPSFLSRRSAFFPEKMRLELGEALQIDRERWNLPKSGETVLKKLFEAISIANKGGANLQFHVSFQEKRFITP